MTVTPIKPKSKTCRICSEKFKPVRAIQPTCGNFDCLVAYAERMAAKAKTKREKMERLALRARRENAKTRFDWLREAQAAFNAFIRERDKNLPCISCGRFHHGSWDAGHYRSVGAAPSLRFNEDNCHRQCVPCNQHKSGNAIEYRLGLVKRIGRERVERLEGPHQPRKWTIEDAKAIRDEYRAKLKAMQKEAA